jgi:hypothetical protein
MMKILDVKKLIQVLRKLITFLKIICNILLFLCCYIIYNAISERDVRVLIFALSMFVVSILVLLFLSYIKKVFWGDD